MIGDLTAVVVIAGAGSDRPGIAWQSAQISVKLRRSTSNSVGAYFAARVSNFNSMPGSVFA